MNAGKGLVLAGAVLWGTTGTAQALAPAGAHPVTVGAVRLVVGAAALLLLAGWQGKLRLRGEWPVRATLLAAGGVAGYQLCFFAGVAATGVAVGAIVAIGSAPIIAGLLSWRFLGEKPDRRWSAATACAIVGCALLVAAGGDLVVNAGGILLAVGAGLSYSIYVLSSKKILERQPAGAATAVVFAIGAIFLLPLLLFGDLNWLTQPRGLAVALHLGIMTVGVSYLLFAHGLALIPAATAVSLTLAEPLTAAALGLFLLGEQLSPAAMAGAALILIGLAVISLTPAKLPQPYKR